MMRKKYNYDHDKNGVKYQNPERSCDFCVLKPCMNGFEKYGVDFAKYGCVDFLEE